MVLLAAFEVLLARYGGDEELDDRHADRRPQPHRAGGADRVFREHAGDARRPARQPDVPRAAGAGEAHRARRLFLRRRAVRAAGRGARPAAQPRLVAADPGAVRLSQRAARISRNSTASTSGARSWRAVSPSSISACTSPCTTAPWLRASATTPTCSTARRWRRWRGVTRRCCGGDRAMIPGSGWAILSC